MDWLHVTNVASTMRHFCAHPHEALQYQQYPPQYQQATPQYQASSPQGSAADDQNSALAQLKLLGHLRESNMLTDDEFQREKQKILNGS